MASNYTANYGLPQWSMDDRILVEDFNDAMTNIDEHLHLKAQVLIGSYVGDGSAERTIALGVTPKAVLLMSSSGGDSPYGGLALAGSDVRLSSKPVLSITNGGFKVYFDNLTTPWVYSNLESTTYHYVAFY